MPKLNLEDVLERLNDERRINSADVHPSTLRATIWLGMVSLNGGYMPHNHAYATTRRHAADCIGHDLPKRKASQLRAGWTVVHAGDVYETTQVTVSELVS